MAAPETARSSAGGGASADSYIGSLISLTSKCEIRYEGVLYNINTEESSIGLRNVRSFGTEGRKKDGPQIPPGDKIYEYILFRGSDIKDLQVKSSPPPVQPAPPPPQPLHNDPAIIQSHYPRSAHASASIPSGGSGADLAGQSGISRTSFQGNLPLYQPGGSLGSWGVSPALPSANGSGVGMPMYWQGFYAQSGGLGHLQQPHLLRPPPGLQMPQSMQQPLQYPGINLHLPSLPPNLSSVTPNLTGGVSAVQSLPVPPNLTGGATAVQSLSSNVPELPHLLPPITSIGGLPSTSVPAQAAALVTEHSQTLPPNKTPFPVTNIVSGLSPEAHHFSKPDPIVEPVPNKVKTTSGPPSTYQTSTPSHVINSELPPPSLGEVVMPSSVIPDHLMQSGTSNISSSQLSQATSRELHIKNTAQEPLAKDPIQSKDKKVAESTEPILKTPQEQKISTPLQMHRHHNSRGRGSGRGRGNGYSRPVMTFSEEFDFTAMNEKFNKDEVWGLHSKSKGSAQEREGDINIDDYDIEEEGYTESSNTKAKPVYVKEDFFDSLSCNAVDSGRRNGRTRFSEQLKIDAETFGDLSKHRLMNRGGRGGRGFRGGRMGGSFYGRGYGYGGRGRNPGRGYLAHNWAS